MELTPRRTVDSSDFDAEDLGIFIDSLETLARIERERRERRQRRKALKTKSVEVEIQPKPQSIIAATTVDSSEAEEDPIQHSKPKQLRCKLFSANTEDISPGHSSDENYFSGGSSSESPTPGSKESIGVATLPSTDSGTESESGVYQLRPRTTRARIIGLVLKREYSEGGSKDELEKQERRERVLEGLLREKEKCESLRLPAKEGRKPIPSKAKKHPTAEMRFIDKALRYLTL